MDEQVVFLLFSQELVKECENSNIPCFAQLNLFETNLSFCECTIILRSWMGLVKLCLKFPLLFYSFIPTYYSFHMYLLFSIMLVKNKHQYNQELMSRPKGGMRSLMAFYSRITLKVCASGYAHVCTSCGKEMER